MKHLQIKILLIFTLVISNVTIGIISNGDHALAVSQDLLDRGAGSACILYDNNDGLPTSEANAIAQTKDGFIWIGSYSGLIRYDGNSFYRYDSSYGVSSVVSLCVGSDNVLWVGTNDSGLAKYENGKFTFYDKDDGLRSLSVRAIVEDKDGNIFVGTTQGIVYLDKEGKLSVFDDPQINTEYIKMLTADKNGTIYGETVQGAFFCIQDKNISWFYGSDAIEGESINCICPDDDHQGYIYLGTDRNYLLYGDVSSGLEHMQKISVAPLEKINCMKKTKNYLWVCSDNGIGNISSEGHFDILKNIPLNSSIDDMLMDYEENIWFASSRQGVMKLVSNQFIDINELAGLGEMVVNTTCRYGDDLYIGADSGLYVVDKDYKKKENKLTKRLKNIRIRCIDKDNDGNMWIATYSGDDGIICVDKDGNIKAYTDKDGLMSNWVRTSFTLKDGSEAVSASGGLNIIKDEKIVESYGADQGIKNSELLTICEGDDGIIYMGSDGDGIYCLQGGSITRIGQEDGLLSEVILRICYDEKRDIYWIITSNSIAYLKDKKVTTIKKFPYTNNFDLCFDKKDNMWVLSSNGLYVVDPDQVMLNGDINYNHYDYNSGMSCVSTANSWSELEDDGTLYIAGTTGVNSININNAVDEAKEVRLAVPYVEIDDEMTYIPSDGKLTIPSNCKRLTIYGYALTFALKNPSVSYKLEGFDKNGITTYKQNLEKADYTNLSGGDYTYRLSVINTMTREVENEISVHFTKEKKFEEKPIFWVTISIAVIIVLFAFIAIYTIRKNAIFERRQREKQNLINEMTEAFAKIIDMKDRYTNGHSKRVAYYTSRIAERMGYSSQQVERLNNIALLHDIGKLAIPDSILNKPEGLTDDEYEIMKSHAAKGKEVLDVITSEPELAYGAGYHHERIDGKGYPEGLKGDEIPMEAQIIAVADTFDAMYSTRPYRKKLKLSVVLDEIRRISGTQLNPDVVKAFLELADEGAFGEG